MTVMPCCVQSQRHVSHHLCRWERHTYTEFYALRGMAQNHFPVEKGISCGLNMLSGYSGINL